VQTQVMNRGHFRPGSVQSTIPDSLSRQSSGELRSARPSRTESKPRPLTTAWT
jgi:hypothetical protein